MTFCLYEINLQVRAGLLKYWEFLFAGNKEARVLISEQRSVETDTTQNLMILFVTNFL